MPSHKTVSLVSALFLSSAVALIAGCSGTSTTAEGNEPAQVAEDHNPANKTEQVNTEYVTKPEQFIPVLQTHHDAVKWPADKDMTAEKIWKKLEPGAYDTMFGENDARSAVFIWNMCAWAAEGIENIKANKPTTQAVEGMKGASVVHEPLGKAVENVIESLQLGDVNELQDFMQANDCDQEFTQ